MAKTTMVTGTTTIIMGAATAASNAKRAALKARQHGGCFGCGGAHPSGLGLDFAVQDDGSVRATWQPRPEFQSYEGIVHGGVIATLLDCAMVHALFARDISAMTGELNVRFRRSVEIGEGVDVRAWLVEERAPLFKLAAEVLQRGAVCARATGRFMQVQRAHASVTVPVADPLPARLPC